jgi:hypothetical protein
VADEFFSLSAVKCIQYIGGLQAAKAHASEIMMREAGRGAVSVWGKDGAI